MLGGSIQGLNVCSPELLWASSSTTSKQLDGTTQLLPAGGTLDSQLGRGNSNRGTRLILYSMLTGVDGAARDSRAIRVQMSETLHRFVVMCDHATLTSGKLSL